MRKIILTIVFVLIAVSGSYSAEWYVGGTLHSSNAIVWQSAAHKNKLATCADFIVAAWDRDKLKPEARAMITSMDNVKLMALELEKALDIAFEVNPDPTKNKTIYTNQKVAGFATILMLEMGWLDL